MGYAPRRVVLQSTLQSQYVTVNEAILMKRAKIYFSVFTRHSSWKVTHCMICSHWWPFAFFLTARVMGLGSFLKQFRDV